MFTWKRFRAFLCLFLSVLMILPAVPVRAQEADTAVTQEADPSLSEAVEEAPEAEIAQEDEGKPASSEKANSVGGAAASQASTASGSDESGGGGDASGLGVSVQTPQATLFNGAASYKIPIEVPPGRAGISPKIALVYNSYRQNGWVGVGWDLDLGAIQKSTKKGIKIDPVTQKYTGTEFIATINGSKADLVKRTDWDSTGKTYGAKIEGSFMRFVALTPDSNGQPQGGWEVTTKEGAKYFYGTTTDSRQSDPATTKPHGTFKWCLNKVQDMDGNYMTITYDKSRGDGEVYPKYIDYTGNSTSVLPTTNRVEFVLESRSAGPDTPKRYTSHFAVQTAYRLSTIKVTSTQVTENSGLVRKYVLIYGSSSTSSRSILKTVTQYGSDGVSALPPVNLTYTEGFNEGAGYTIDFPKVMNGAPYSGGYRMADVNNDRFQDIVYTSTSYTSNIRVLLSTESGFKDDASWGTRSAAGFHASAGGIQLVDMNLDGRADFVYVDANKKIHVLLAQPPSACGSSCPDGCFAADSTASPAVWGTQAGNSIIGYRLADVNGDGYLDYIYVNAAKDIKVLINNNGTGFKAESKWGNTSVPMSVAGLQMADMNGDGMSDCVYLSQDHSLYILYSNSTGFQADASGRFVTGLSTTMPNITFRLTDVNGDGLPDIVLAQLVDDLWNGKDVYEFINTVNGLIAAPSSRLGTGFVFDFDDPYLEDFNMVDLNRDGLADLLFDQAFIEMALSKGDGFENTSGHVWGHKLYTDRPVSYVMSDTNGDGLSDFVYSFDFNNCKYFHAVLGREPYPDLLQTVTNGIGGTYTLGYTPSSAYASTNLPYVVQTLSSVTLNDGNGNQSVTNYTYAGGLHSFKEREFEGFASATVTSPKITNRDGTSYQTSVETRFYQGNPTTGADDEKKGLIKEQVVKDKISGKYYKKSKFTISTASYLSGAVKFPYLSQQDDYVWDGASTSEKESTAWRTYATFVYDSYGNITKKYFKGDASVTGDKKTEETQYLYDTTNWLLSRPSWTRILNASSTQEAKTSFTYYSSKPHRLYQKTSWLDGVNDPVVTYEAYDSYGNLTKVLDPNGNRTTTTYDSTYTFPATVTTPPTDNAPGGLATSTTYDYRFGKPYTKTDPNLNTTSYRYDAFGRASKVFGPYDTDSYPTSYYEYLSFGAPGSQKVKAYARDDKRSGSGTYHWVETYFDGLGREIKTRTEGAAVTGQNVIVTNTSYDLGGHVQRKYLPYFEGSTATKTYTEFNYEPLGRVMHTVYPDRNVSSRIVYRKNKTTLIDPNKHVKVQTRDAYGRLSVVEEYTGTYPGQSLYAKTTYFYDARGNLKEVRDAYNQSTFTYKTSIAYDALSRKIEMIDPDMGHWYYTVYDKNGNLKEQEDARGVVINFDYDSLNRVEKKYCLTDPSINVDYYYDESTSENPGGRVTKVVDVTGETRFYYDKEGHTKKSVKKPAGVAYEYVTETAYDAMGRPTGITYPAPSGETRQTVSYTYDAGLHLASVSGSADYSNYTASGQAGTITHANGLVTNYSYDDMNRVATIVTTGSSSLVSLTYTYDYSGNIVAIADNAGAQDQTFTYDDLNRLLTAYNASYSSGVVTYAYDKIGNIDTTSKYGNYSYQVTHPHAVTTIGSDTYQYDANGNMISKTVGGVVTTLAYDAENRVKSITKGSSMVQFTYDYTGKRVKKTPTGASETLYIGNLLEIEGTVSTKHTFAGPGRVVSKIGTDLRYYHTDHLDSMRKTTDASGTVKQTAFYYPFGEEVTPSTGLPYKFTGQEEDPETGLYYYRARYYDQKIGRFISPDSIVQALADPQTLNRYSYCRNNPLRYTDPTGHQSEEDEDNEEDEKHYIEIVITGPSYYTTNVSGSSGNDGVDSAFSGDGGGQNGQVITLGDVGDILWANLITTPGRIYQDAVNAFWWPIEHPEEVLLLLLIGEIVFGKLAVCPMNALVPYKEWPEMPQGGFLGEFIRTGTLQPGQVFSRIGELTGRYVSPLGTNLSQRGLPSNYLNQTETLWAVTKPFKMEGGISSPWKDASGLGVQWRLERSIQELWNKGYIKPYFPK